MEFEMSDAMKTREYADWLDGLSVTSKPCPKALKRIANRLRALEAQLAEVAGLRNFWQSKESLHKYNRVKAEHLLDAADDLTAILAKYNK